MPMGNTNVINHGQKMHESKKKTRSTKNGGEEKSRTIDQPIKTSSNR